MKIMKFLVPSLLAFAITLVMSFGSTTAASASQFQKPSPAQLATQVADFRADQNRLIDSYVRTYGSRFTSTERTEITKAQRQANQSLLSLHRSLSKVSRLSRTGASKKKINAATITAQRAYKRAQTSAETTQQSLEPILRNRLSLFESLAAYRDYSDSMARFTEIGTKINEMVSR
jgi:hypothetical protein